MGFRLGPQGAPLSNYVFSLEAITIDAWLNDIVKSVKTGMMADNEIAQAIMACNSLRGDILTSMAYQMEVVGFGKFRYMLESIHSEN